MSPITCLRQFENNICLHSDGKTKQTKRQKGSWFYRGNQIPLRTCLQCVYVCVTRGRRLQPNVFYIRFRRQLFSSWSKNIRVISRENKESILNWFFVLSFSGKENRQKEEDQRQILQFESVLERIIRIPYWWNGYEESLPRCHGEYQCYQISEPTSLQFISETASFMNTFRKS